MLCYPKQLRQDQDVSCESLYLYLSGFMQLMDSVRNLEPLQFYFWTAGSHRGAERSEVLVNLRRS